MAWPTRSKNIRLFSWWGVLIISTLCALVVGTGVALLWPSNFSATSSFFVSDPADLLGTMLKDPAAAATPGLPEAGKLKPTQERLAAILSSRYIRSRLVQKHGLARKFGRDPVEAEEILARMANITAIGNEGFSIRVSCRGYSRLRTLFGRALGRQEARELSAALANDYLAELETFVTATAVGEARRKREFIQTAQRQVVSQLSRAESGLETLQTQHELIDPASKAAEVSDRVKALQQAEAEAVAQVAEAGSSLKKAQGQMGRVDAMRIASIVEMRNPVIGTLEQKLAELRVDLATQEAQGKTRENRDVQQVLSAIESTQAQLEHLKQDVHKEVAQAANPTYEKVVSQVTDLQVALAGARARQRATSRLLAAARGRLTDLPPVSRQFSALKQDQDVQFAALAALKQSLAVALVQEQQSKRVGEFLVLDQAVPPPDLYGPPIWQAMVVAFVGVLCFMGLGALNRMIFGS